MFLQNVCCLPHFVFLLPKHFTLFQLTTESLSHAFVILEMHCRKKGRVWAVFNSLWLLSSCSAIRFPYLWKRFLKLSCRSSPVLGHLPDHAKDWDFIAEVHNLSTLRITLFIPNVWNFTITKCVLEMVVYPTHQSPSSVPVLHCPPVRGMLQVWNQNHTA